MTESTAVRTRAADRATPSAHHFREVAQAVRAAGLLERTRGFSIGLLAALTALTAVTIGVGVLLGASWFVLIVAAVLGVLLTQFAFVAHEASHRQVLRTGPANDRLGRILAAGVVGISHQWWMSKHSRHHANPNQLGRDPDIEVDTISFVDDDARAARGLRRWITRRQGWLFFPLLALEGLNLHVHHLFPNMARPHLPAAAAIVRAHCSAHGIPYTETGLLQSYGIVVRYLNRVGLAARDPFECPMLAQRRLPTGD